MRKGAVQKAAMLVACALLTTNAAGCSGCTRAGRKARFLARGDTYLAEGKYKEAVLEYRNFLQLEPESHQVDRKLAIAAYQAGQTAAAFAFLQKALEADPADLEVRLKLGTLQLLARQPEKAREHARFVLARKPDDLVAAGLLADSAQTPEEVDEAIALLESRPEHLEKAELVDRALGLLYARKNDVPRAEKALMAAVAAKPDSPEAHSMLARLHGSKGELDAAEKELRAAAGLSAPGSRFGLELADFLMGVGKPAAARAVLEEITQKVPDASPAWIRLAELAFQEKRLDDCAAATEAVLKGQPDNTAALVIRARVELARGETQKGLETATRVVKLDGRLAAGHYALALAHLQSGNLRLARNSAGDALARAPQYADALFLTASLAMRSGDAQAAVLALRSYIDKVPNDPRPHLQLGTALLQAKQVADAADSFRAFAKMAPRDPRGPFMLGIAARMEGKAGEARRYFEEALSVAPGFPDPLVQLTDMSFRDRKPDAAVERAKKQADAAPQSAEVAFVLASAYLKAGKRDKAEREFLRVIELKPDAMAPYGQLASLYSQAKDYSSAHAMIEKALAKDPDNAGMLMLAAVIAQAEGAVPQARELYEKILSKRPKFAAAANNLAYLLADEGRELRRAQALAQTARSAAPEDPDVADTLGWVLYKQGTYPSAIVLFRESLEKRPDNPEVLVHLGLAYDKLGDKESAKAAIKKALELNPNVPGAAEAKAILET